MRYQPIDSTLHGLTDYTVGTTLMTVFPRIAGVEGTESARQIRASGAFHAGYSTLTDYPLGAVKVIPYKAHLALDAVGALALAATPFITGQWKKGRKHWVPHIALGAFELMSLAMSDPSGRGSSHGDPAKISEKNALDPQQKISDPTPAVKAGSAMQSAGQTAAAQP